ncbi:MAG: glycosyltransferase family 2 protein [Cyanobacteriota bacterium]|jgi:GT2 family glycosyltransferase
MSVNSYENPADAGSIKLAVIIPLYGNWDDTLDCTKMLAGQSSMNFHLYLADDGSSEPPPPEIDSFEFLTYYRRPHAGFASTCNAAALRAADEGFTHILLLNNDTSFGSDFIQTWIEKVNRFPDAIMGPQIYYTDDPGKLWYSGGSKSILIPFFRFNKEYNVQSVVDILTGCVLLVPVKTWLALGGFDETYVTYYEDFDFLLRARDAGVTVYLLIEKELRVWHKVSRTSLMHGRWNREYRMLSSRLLFIRKRYMGIEMLICLALTIPHVFVLGCLNFPELPKPARLLRAFKRGFQQIRPTSINQATQNVS